MRKFFCASLFLMFAATTLAQTFSFQMCFENAVGNKDTITLGYDLMATDSIDSIFGEVNIISLPFDSTLDVRVSNKSRNNNIRLFHTKKQVINYNCDYFSFINGIDIATRHWPVTATWDNTLFYDSCRKGTFFTSISPGGWWDTGSPSDLFVVPMRDSNSVTFSSNYSNEYPNYSYLNGSDTISFFWLAYADSFSILSSIENPSKDNLFILYPNPTLSILTISIPVYQDLKVRFFDVVGREISSKEIQNSEIQIDVSSWQRGVYFYSIAKEGMSQQNGKIVLE